MLNQWLDWASIRHFLLNTAGFFEKKRVAVTGWTNGSLTNPVRPNYIRVRFLDDDAEVEAWNENVPHVSGLQIYVYSDKDDPMTWRARYPSKNYTSDFKFVFNKPHATNHDYYSMDPSMISVRQFLPFHPSLSGAWTIRVRPGWITFGDQIYWFGGETIDLADHRPDTGARYVLVTASLVDVDGVMTVKMIVTDGEPAIASAIKAPDNFPAMPEGQHHPILAAKLNQARSSMKDVLVGGDIIDLRLAAGSGGGGSGSIVSLPPSRMIITDSDGHPITNSPLWDPEGRVVWLENEDFVPPGTDLFGMQCFSETITPGAQYVRAANTNNAGSVNFVKYGGTLLAPTEVLLNWRLGSISFGGHYGTGIDAIKARFSSVATEQWSENNRGCGFVFSATPNGSKVIEDVAWLYGDHVAFAKSVFSTVTEPDETDDNRFVTAEWVRNRIDAQLSDGWIPVQAVCSYIISTVHNTSGGVGTSNTTYSGIIELEGDWTHFISSGAKWSHVQLGVIHYYGVHKVELYGGNTRLTLFGGTDHQLVNSEISLPAYSLARVPNGFPISKPKWQVTWTQSSDYSRGSPVLDEWYNIGFFSVFLGNWDIEQSGLIASISTANQSAARVQATLSTGIDTESDNTCSVFSGVSGAPGTIVSLACYGIVRPWTLLSTTTLYLNIRFTNTAATMASLLTARTKQPNLLVATPNWI